LVPEQSQTEGFPGQGVNAGCARSLPQSNPQDFRLQPKDREELVALHSALQHEFPRMAGNSPQDAANSLLVSINSLFCTIKFPVPISRELSCNQLILLRSVGQILAQRPNFYKNSLF
jgi:hypothetical protein